MQTSWCNALGHSDPTVTQSLTVDVLLPLGDLLVQNCYCRTSHQRRLTCPPLPPQLPLLAAASSLAFCFCERCVCAHSWVVCGCAC